jgi:UDP-N-acetylglucosamine 2-epimerase (non-hydrolysing)
MKRVLIVVGVRPNIVKITRFRRVIEERGRLALRIVHTGQHASPEMSEVFLERLGVRPDRRLLVPGGTPTRQVADMMVGMEGVIAQERPDLVLVVGDVNGTLAAALAANRMGVPIGHLESGLRSFDRSMPEEHNRVLVDRLADLFFCTESSGVDHLRAEGAPERAIHLVGNTMIDTLVAFDREVRESTVLEDLGLGAGGHALLTLHRPATVDDPVRLAAMLDLVADVSARRPVVFPVHPRTAANLAASGLESRAKSIRGLRLTAPLDYFAFQRLVATAGFVLTDSGGVQEETTFRRVPCLTLRPNTERPVTVTLGTNELVLADPAAVAAAIARIDTGAFRKGEIPPLWDGHATERVVEILERTV